MTKYSIDVALHLKQMNEADNLSFVQVIILKYTKALTMVSMKKAYFYRVFLIWFKGITSKFNYMQ